MRDLFDHRRLERHGMRPRQLIVSVLGMLVLVITFTAGLSLLPPVNGVRIEKVVREGPIVVVDFSGRKFIPCRALFGTISGFARTNGAWESIATEVHPIDLDGNLLTGPLTRYDVHFKRRAMGRWTFTLPLTKSVLAKDIRLAQGALMFDCNGEFRIGMFGPIDI